MSEPSTRRATHGRGSSVSLRQPNEPLSRADEIIQSGDVDAILSMALGAAFSDERCECDEPALTGNDLMCGNCLREHEGQREKANARIREPHAFEPADPERNPGLAQMGWCRVCTNPKDDPRHA